MQTWGRDSSFGLCFPAIDDYILNCTTREIYSIHSSFLLIFRVICLLHRHFYLVCWFTFEHLENQESQWNNFHSFSTMAQVFFFIQFISSTNGYKICIFLTKSQFSVPISLKIRVFYVNTLKTNTNCEHEWVFLIVWLSSIFIYSVKSWFTLFFFKYIWYICGMLWIHCWLIYVTEWKVFLATLNTEWTS